jgi:hypothetical protein
MLMPHAHSLKSLKLGLMTPSAPSDGTSPLANLEHLTHLQVSIYSIECDRGSEAAALLAAPSLASVTFDYTVPRAEHAEQLLFDALEARWIREFTGEAKKLAPALASIEVILGLSKETLQRRIEFEAREGMKYKYPWDVLRWTGEATQKLGVKLVYGERIISREEWDVVFADQC